MTMPGVKAGPGAYERAGEQAAVIVRGYSSVLVVSDNPVAAALVGLGIARAETEHRKVVVGDLIGDIAPIQSLVTSDDQHGIYDSFVFGTSLERVMHAVPDNGNLNILRSGTESPATAEILGNRRWRQIASDFASADALLLLVASTEAPGLKVLMGRLDGVIVVGDADVVAEPAVLLARIPHPLPVPIPRKITVPIHQPFWRANGLGLASAAVVLLAAALLVFRPGELGKHAATRPADTVMLPDLPRSDSAQRARNAVAGPSNSADSAGAAAYSIEILNANTAEGANFELQRHGTMMPAATISMVPIGDTEAIWYKVVAGAFADSAQANRLLASLRRRRVISDSTAGRVLHTPLALRVDSVPAQAAVLSKSREKVQAFAARGLAVYALMQPDGSARLYAGAFENPEQTSLAATALRVAGVTPVLEYRTGRVQ